ncbi:MAG: sigma-70 family RNA polymerase sigma factor [Candidatus Eremiobacteraeota bacterium]|nr:sigma-70 family RNA polymerase sigma factor [Candidatus Eremiobacteraeota bacterium]MBV9737563.1 sigma-70 family RNA polymerase sigma factor [Candidatus Eremiobacteraeota bacterium]
MRAARKFVRPGLERCDLEQVAAIGLLKACDRYEPAAGTPFEAYAWLFVIGELMHYVRDWERPIRPPRKLRSLELKLRRASEELVCTFGRKPTDAELAQHLGITLGELAGVLECRARSTASSLESLAPASRRAIANDSALETTLDRLVIKDACSVLTEAERAVLWGVYSGGFSQLEIARRLGYSPRHVSRMHRAALGKIAPLCAVH